jgi:hypothetical protein
MEQGGGPGQTPSIYRDEMSRATASRGPFPACPVDWEMFTVRIDGRVSWDGDRFTAQRGDVCGDDVLDRRKGRKAVARGPSIRKAVSPEAGSRKPLVQIARLNGAQESPARHIWFPALPWDAGHCRSKSAPFAQVAKSSLRRHCWRSRTDFKPRRQDCHIRVTLSMERLK